MTGTTISGIHLANITLSNAVIQNPATVVSGATVSAAGSALLGEVGTYWTLDNDGLIEGSGGVGTGVAFAGGGTVANLGSGTISGTNHGVAVGGVGTVFNQGSIYGGDTGTNPGAVYLIGGGYVSNASGGVLRAAGSGILGLGAGSVTVANAGRITAATDGIYLGTGGSVTNQSGGTITGISGDTTVGFGVLVTAGGTVSNRSGGTISGGRGGVYAKTVAATVVNAGSIAGAADGGYGVYLGAGGYITNLSSGIISARDAVYLHNGAILVNAGSIGATSTNTGSGVTICDGGGVVTNQSGGVITGFYGVFADLDSTPTTIVNTGRIIGDGGGGIFIASTGTITNQSGGVIAGNSGIRAIAAATVVNAGSLIGNLTEQTAAGISAIDGLSFTNLSTGTITGYSGIYAIGGATVVNAGSIGGTTAIAFGGGYANRLVIDPGAVFSGLVDGGNTIGAIAVSTLELASAASAGTLTGLGASYIHFVNVTADAGATWTLASDTLGAGYTLIDAGTLTNTGRLDDAVTLTAGAALTNASGGTISISAGAAVLVTPGGSAASITNRSGGTIAGGNGIGAYGTASVVNAGRIAASAPSGIGIDLAAGGAVTNQSGGTITGYKGVAAGTATVDNAGTITGNATGMFGRGVYLYGGGALTNQSGGTISAFKAVYAIVDPATVVNAGAITGNATGAGVYLTKGGQVTNQVGGTIAGGVAIVADGVASVVNAASIAGANTGSGIGIYLTAGGTVTNQSGGSIAAALGIAADRVATITNAGSIDGAASFGVNLAAGGTLTNGGAISGATDAVAFAAGATNLLVIDPGATFVGTVNGGNTIGAASISTLELASGAAAGTLSGLGAQYVDFGQITINTGASWTLSGSNSLASGGTITNAGTLTLADATLTDAGALVNDGGIVLDPSTMTVADLTGTGTVTLQAGSTLVVTGSIGSGETIVFAGNGAYLDLQSPTNIAGDITAFAAGETIDLKGIAPDAVTYSDGELLINGSEAFALGVQTGNTLQIGSSGDGTALTALPPSAIGELETSGPINFGTLYQGMYAASPLTILNTGSAGSANLDVTTTTSGDAFANGTINDLAPGATDNSDINAGIDTSTPGVQTGNVTLNFASDFGSAGTVSAGSAEIEVIGTVYGPAVAALSSAPVYAHLGQSGGSVTVSITIANTAVTNGYAEYLNGQVINFGTYVTGASGSVSRIAPGASNDTAMAATLADTSYGSYSGEVEVALQSDGTGIDSHGTSSLGNSYVVATVIVDHYAIAAIEDIGGSGTLTPTGTASSYVLNLGTVALNGTPLSANIGVLNDVAGPADLLGGSFTVSGASAFDNTGLTAFGIGTSTAGLAAGQVNSAPDITLDTDTPGTFSETITLDPTGYNPSGYAGALATETVTVSGTVLCFLAGTQIATPTGETLVEQLGVGDMVLTARGQARPIVWIGTGSVLATRGRRNAATPVIVRRGALADNVPTRDLHLTKGHALFVDGVLIPVEELINHRSIIWDDHAQEVTLYHVELETHDVLIANGAPAESYRDDGNRWLFRNANSGWGLPPHPPCAPILADGPVVDAVWQRLQVRAGPRPGLPLTEDADLHLMVDGRRVDPVRRCGEVHLFRLEARPAAVRIVSRASMPQELGVVRDPRMLGVALRRIVLRQGPRLRLIEAADAALTDGFHAFEATNGFRWTDGSAAVPRALFQDRHGAFELELHIGCSARYAIEPRVRAA